jgi:hypothetical protein
VQASVERHSHGRGEQRAPDRVGLGEDALRRLDDRLHDVALRVYEDFYRTALEDPDLEAWLATRRTLRAAVHAITELRRMRLGYRSTGDWFRVPPDKVSMAEMREWINLKRKYAMHGGLYA